MSAASLRAAVLGHPVAHSRSPQLHRAAYELIGFDCAYERIEVPEADAGAFAQRLRTEPGWAGVSVTMPLKAAMVPFMDAVTDSVAAVGVLNTVVVSGSGPDTDAGAVRLTGHNTDVAGLVNALRQAGVRQPARAVVLGAGGTAQAAVAALAALSAPAAEVHARSFRPGPDGRSAVAATGARAGIDVLERRWEDAAAACAAADVVICTLPPRGADAVAAELEALGADRTGAVLLDAAYDPWPSALARAWQDAGGRIVPGLEMLLYQAVEQIRLFTGQPLPDPASVINVMCDAVGLPRR